MQAPMRKFSDSVDLGYHLLMDWQLERTNLSADSLAVVGWIIHLGRRLKASESLALKPFNMQDSDFDVLAPLRHSGKPFEMTRKQLQESVLLSAGAMSACLHRYLWRGFNLDHVEQYSGLKSSYKEAKRNHTKDLLFAIFL